MNHVAGLSKETVGKCFHSTEVKSEPIDSFSYVVNKSCFCCTAGLNMVSGQERKGNLKKVIFPRHRNSVILRIIPQLLFL